MELYFDKIADNEDPRIIEVDLGVRNARFMSLLATEKTKAATAFATNAHVKTLRMIHMQLDDDFARALGKALETNNTLEKVVLDSNPISGEGIEALFAGLAKNDSVLELQIGNQSKSIVDEESLPALLEPNMSLVRLSLARLRNGVVQGALDKITYSNLQKQKAKNKDAALFRKSNGQTRRSNTVPRKPNFQCWISRTNSPEHCFLLFLFQHPKNRSPHRSK